MAEASVTVTVTRVMPLAGEGALIFGTLAIDADPDVYATGGLALGATEFGAKAPICPAGPEWMIVFGIAGYHYEFDGSNSLLLIRGQKNAASNYDPLIELSTGAIPAAVSGDTITFIAMAKKLG